MREFEILLLYHLRRLKRVWNCSQRKRDKRLASTFTSRDNCHPLLPNDINQRLGGILSLYEHL
ncbi:hypothetical protein POREN0001_0756 [Porphyromonas endodontalis ATCC 35406]|uniref:Uncharacterized protein n=1 Tax=Porphyromonas endodontalis (strain ATCC 35406 / DSM 24491 / JCM 8526 / CCUG 16442 / BCRC 14492 / NCTC 13058 / HG 370) TaxID=553175 RepID=C3J9K5_POREA|nr:hypothetical protein POREN0001_0756 [Porphyromonas endodontalis ATCC 35406]